MANDIRPANPKFDRKRLRLTTAIPKISLMIVSAMERLFVN
jgi:hypothetical protein